MRIKIYLILFLSLFAVFYPIISGFSLSSYNLDIQNMPPSWSHPMGTDIKGLDMAGKIARALGLTLSIAVLSTIVSLFIGVFYGITAGYLGGKIDWLMMRFVDILYGLPFTMLVIVMMTLFGRNIFFLFLALGFVQWLTMARIIRGQTLSVRNESFVEYSRASGASAFFIITRHIFPNVMAIAITYSTLLLPAVILEESFISYLGLGVKPPFISLGSLISEGFKGITPLGFNWWLFIIPILFLIVTVYLFFSLGNALREKYE